MNPFMIAGTVLNVMGSNALLLQNHVDKLPLLNSKSKTKSLSNSAHYKNTMRECQHTLRINLNCCWGNQWRGAGDRSIAAIKKAQSKSQEDLGRAATQSMFTQSRMQFAADDARAVGSLAMQTGFLSLHLALP